MSILEDLDLMDLLDELPAEADFDLDDILFEFSTPGLFAAPEKEQKEIVPEVEVEIEEPAPEVAAEEVLPEVIAEETSEAFEEEEPFDVTEEEEPVAKAIDDGEDDVIVIPDIPLDFSDAEEEADFEHNDATLFGDSLSLCDVLFEFGTPVDDEGVKVYSPAAQAEIVADEDEDDVKVYIPEAAPEAIEAKAEEPVGTVVFTALDEQEVQEAVQPEQAPAQAKAPGFFAKAAAAVMGLFASKKAAKAAAVPAAPEAPAEEDILPVLTADSLTDDAEIPVIGFTEAEEAPVPEAEDVVSEAELLFLFADEELDGETVSAIDEEETIPVIDEESVTVIDEEDDVTVIDEEDTIPVIDEEEAATVIDEEEAVTVIDEEEAVTVIDEEDTIPVIDEDEDVTVVRNAETELYDTGVLFTGPLDINDILYECSSYEEESEEPVLPLPEDLEEEDIKVYIPEDTSAVQPIEKQPDPTILFDALDLSTESDSAQAQPAVAPVQPKAPGFFAKAAGLVMGLFAAKKAAKAVTPAVQPVPTASTEDAFANVSDLFSEAEAGELYDVDDLMLELELEAEREAELEAEAAAREAAERLAREEEQRIMELEAQRLAQAEADAEAEAARLKAAEDARMKAETDALLMHLQADDEPVYVPDTPVSETTVDLQVPVLEERPAESDTPTYDFAAVDLPTQEKEYTAPQMDISIDEEVPEEVGDLLEMPDVEQTTAEPEETPEEAAARKKKEEDNLHYKPEESAAKTVTSHIGKRFGAAFAAFTNFSDDCDDEEALGPELPSNKAYRFFNKFINAYRFRLRISTVLCVILGWISLGLPVFGSLKNPAAAAAMCLMILLTVMLAGADILAVGVRSLIGKRPGVHSLVAVSCLASVIDAIVIVATKGVGGYLPFCGVSAISMCFAIYGSLLYCRSQRLNFKTLDRANEPMTISVDYGIVEEDTSTVYRTPGHPEGYIHHSEEEDLSETVFGIIAPVLIPAIPVMTLLAALFSGGFGDFFHIMAAMFAAAASFGALIAFPLPYFLVQRDLYGTKAAIAGWAGAREIGRVSSMIVTDRDLFPDDTVSIKSVRIVDNVPPDLTLSYICSMIHRSGSCLVPAFTQLAENNECELKDVENFQCHEAGGLSGIIGPDDVLVASHSYMKLQGFRIPARKKDSENALFLAVNGHVIAYIIVDYKPIKSVRAGLQSALRGNVEMIFAARDFNVTPLLISKKFKSATETLRFPSYSQRYEITSQVNSETATCAAVVYRKSFYSYAVVVEKARYLYNSVTWGVILSTVSSILGVLLMFIMALTGAGAAVTVSRLLVFMLLWLIPTLALTVSITK
ncbi:MAG: hypothetical protein IJD81_03945 [Oscillospiraceae bacterium]|nr:hypothetical protein [Oscillospiraceae bacterium]